MTEANHPPASLDALAADWPPAPTPIEAFPWISACAAGLRSSSLLNVFAVTDHGRLTGAAPFERIPSALGDRLSLLGVAARFEPMDLPVADERARAALVDRIVASGSPFILGRLPADSPTIDLIRQAIGRRGVLRVRPAGACPRIALDDTWIEPEEHLSSRRRGDLRRAQRRAEAMGPVRTEIISPELSDLDRLLDEAYGVEGRSWKGEAGTALSHDREAGDFFRRYARAVAALGQLRLGFLRIGGAPAAMQLGVVHGDSFWLMKMSYDDAYARCSPGMLLLRHAVANAASEGLKSFELLGQTEPWVDAWTRDTRETVSLSAYPASAAGAGALASDGLAGVRRVATRQGVNVVRRARSRGRAVAELAARRYVAGSTAEDARRAAERLRADHGVDITLGYWDGEGDTPAEVTDHYLQGLDVLAGIPGSYVSIKLPALGSPPEEGLVTVARRCQEISCRLHFDSLAPETAVSTWTHVEGLAGSDGVDDIGVTLPGRWRRSITDADRAVSAGLAVRIVKGQWADPEAPDLDMREGFLAVVDRLAGRARYVAVATHDADLAAEALGRLARAATPCGLELLYGLPMRQAAAAGRSAGVGIRVYVPYGAAYLPYALDQVRRSPQLSLRLARDLAGEGIASFGDRLRQGTRGRRP